MAPDVDPAAARPATLTWSLVIPVKVLAQAKSRLTGLAGQRRSEFALAMAADTVAADLREHGVSVHQHAAAALLQLGYPIHVAQVEMHVAVAALLVLAHEHAAVWVYALDRRLNVRVLNWLWARGMGACSVL